jgi:predicted HicB family RNase H-like nuclease
MPPKGPYSEAVQVRFTPEMQSWLQLAAAREEVSVSAIIRLAVGRWIVSELDREFDLDKLLAGRVEDVTQL